MIHEHANYQLYFKTILWSSIKKYENIKCALSPSGKRVGNKVFNSFVKQLQNLKKIKWIKMWFFNIPKTKIFNEHLLQSR